MASTISGDPLRRLSDQIRHLLASANLEDALEELRALSLNGPAALSREALLLPGQWAFARRERRKGVITDEQFGVIRARVSIAALELLDELEKRLTPSSAPVQAPAPNAPLEAAPGNLEKIIGINNLKQVSWLEQGLTSSRAVARVHTPRGMGTGFLVGPQLLMTNHHVIASPEVAMSSKVEFNYQLPFAGAVVPSGAVRYDLDPVARFQTDADLDYTLVAVRADPSARGPAVDSWGKVKLNPNADPLPGEHVAVIQHPNGGPKQIVLTSNAVMQLKVPYVHYSTDTMPGSSGSPVFNDLWEVVAIHHAAGPEINSAVGVRYSNEGILMSAIRTSLGTHWPA